MEDRAAPKSLNGQRGYSCRISDDQSGVLLQVNLSTTTDHHTLPSLVILVGLVNLVTLDTPVIPVNTPSLVTLVNFKLVGQVLGSE